METELITRSAVYAFAVPLIVALVEVVKRLIPGPEPERYAPLAAIVLGQCVAFIAVAAVPEPPQFWGITVLIGLGLGLGASGLYSGGRAALKV